MKREVNKEIKVMWLSRMFYGVSHAYDLNINPYDDLAIFLNAKVGSMNWGNNKLDTKERFCKKYHTLLELYGIRLALKYIMSELKEEGQFNSVAVEHWAEHSEFPSTW